MNNRNPIPSSITHPEAEQAHRDLSWSPTESDDDDEARYETAEENLLRHRAERDKAVEHVYSSYAGAPDGSWTITVTIERQFAVSTQTESGSGEKGHTLREAKQSAYEKADRAITILQASS
jgi:hypothetical protein